MADDELKSDLPTGYYTDFEYAESILHNLQDMTWFMWNYGNAFFIPLLFLITF